MDRECHEAVPNVAGWFLATSGAACRGVPFHGERGIYALGGRPGPIMLADAGALGPADETCREYERVVDAKYLDQIRTEAKQFSNKRLSLVRGCQVRNTKLQERDKHYQATYNAEELQTLPELPIICSRRMLWARGASRVSLAGRGDLGLDHFSKSIMAETTVKLTALPTKNATGKHNFHAAGPGETGKDLQ
jgi:hypothetical protein